MITKELLNKNRVLTMSTNRKCDYLVVDVSSNKCETIMIGVNTQGNTKDILVVKTFTNKTFDDLAKEAYWTCKEFDIHIVLVDRNGYGIGFIDSFNKFVPDDIVSLREVNIFSKESIDFYQYAYLNIENDLKNGVLRFLQTTELAYNSYQKQFLGYSNIMEFHTETDKLIDEIANIKPDIVSNRIKLSMVDNNIGKLRCSCLLIYYSYPYNCIDKNKLQNDKKEEQYYIAKNMCRYYINRGILYKYMFKSIEIKDIKTIFYYKDKSKIRQFANMVIDKEFKDLFNDYISTIKSSKEELDIYLDNGSAILFRAGLDSSRGCRYHFAIVDTDINNEIYNNVIYPKGVLFEMARRDGVLKDNYNIEYIEM